MTDKKTTQEVTRSPIDGSELVRLATPGAPGDNWKTTIDSALDANWQTSRSSFSGTELVRISGASSLNWKAPVSAILDANWETTLNPVTGAEVVRVTDASSGNWKTTISNALNAPHTVDNRTATTFAALPSAVLNSGAIVRITDSNTTRVGYPAAGGGGNLVSVQSDGTIWRVIGSPYGRRVLCGNALFYLSPTGSDITGDGQITNPYQTFNRALDDLYGVGTGAGIDTNGFITTFALTDGVHDYSNPSFGGVAVDFSQAWDGGGPIQIQSVSGNASACEILGGFGAAGTAITISGQLGGKLTVQNLSFRGWHSNVWGGWYGAGVVWCINLIHGDGQSPNHIECASPNVHMQIFGTDKVDSFFANSHLFARQGGRMHYWCSSATIVNSTMTIVAGWCRAQDDDSDIDFEPPTFTGTYVGPRWNLSGGANLAIWGNGNWTPKQPQTAIPNSSASGPDLIMGDASLQYALNANLYQSMGGIKTEQQIRFTGEYSDGVDYVTITPYRETGSSNLTTTYSLALPQIQGLPGANLQNDGTGQLSWVNGLAVSSASYNYYLSKISGLLVGGSSYTPGVYPNVAFTGGSGSSATAEITVGAGGNVTLVKPRFQGSSYVIGDILSAPSSIIGSSGAGFTFTVQAIGSDSSANTGLSSATPFATLTHALSVVAGYNWQSLYTVSIFPDNGIYDEGNNILFPQLNTLGLPSIRGRTSNPEAIYFQTVSDVFLFTAGGNWTSWGLTLHSAGSGGGIAVGTSGYFEIYDMHYKTADDCLITNGDGTIYSERNTINPLSTSRPAGLYRGIGNGSQGYIVGPTTILSSFDIPSVSWNAFVRLQPGSRLNISSAFVGSSLVTGRQYLIDDNCVYNGPALSDLPGTTGGTVSPAALINGAVYDFIDIPSSVVTPAATGEMMFERASPTQINIVMNCTDSVIRRGAITLSSS